MSDVDQWLEELSRDWGVDFARLRVLQDKAHEIEARLSALYREKFPKKCNSCGLVFETRDDYIKATVPTGEKHVRFDRYIDKVQEFRNCVCGSTLLLVLPERRDLSEFGHERRAIFDQFVDLIVEMKKMDREEARILVRKVFRTLANRPGTGR